MTITGVAREARPHQPAARDLPWIVWFAEHGRADRDRKGCVGSIRLADGDRPRTVGRWNRPRNIRRESFSGDILNGPRVIVYQQHKMVPWHPGFPVIEHGPESFPLENITADAWFVVSIQ